MYAILKLTITINLKKTVAVDAKNESSHGVAEIKLDSMQIYIHLLIFALKNKGVKTVHDKVMRAHTKRRIEQ